MFYQVASDMQEIKSRVQNKIAEGDNEEKHQRSRQSHSGNGSSSHRLTKEDEGKYGKKHLYLQKILSWSKKPKRERQ